MMGWGWGHGVGAGIWVSWLLLVLLIGLVVFLVARASGGDTHRPPQEPPPRPTGRSTAQEILAGRYARGEISTEEYEERLSHLRE